MDGAVMGEFKGYDEYGRAIYVDIDPEGEWWDSTAQRKAKHLVSEAETVVVTELCVHCGEPVHFNSRFDHWFHRSGVADCAGRRHKAEPTTWTDAR